MLFRRLLILSFGLISCLLPASASQWTKLESDHLSIISDDEGIGFTTLANLEDARAVLVKLGLPVKAPSKPITVLVVSKHDLLTQAWPVGGGAAGTLGGLTYAFEDR